MTDHEIITGVPKSPVGQSSETLAPSSDAEALPATTPHGAVEAERRGRTAWDFASEELERRRRKHSTNWYRFFFYVLVVTALVASFKWLNDALNGIRGSVVEIAHNVGAVKSEAAKTAGAAADIRFALVGSPNFSGWFGHHKMKTVACKARGLEAIQGAGGKNINASQDASVYATFSAAEHTPQYIGIVHCLEDYHVYVLVAGPDGQTAGIYQAQMKAYFSDGPKK